MYFGACRFALARHVLEKSQNVAEYFAKMSMRSPICQWPGSGIDADISADADMPTII